MAVERVSFSIKHSGYASLCKRLPEGIPRSRVLSCQDAITADIQKAVGEEPKDCRVSRHRKSGETYMVNIWCRLYYIWMLNGSFMVNMFLFHVWFTGNDIGLWCLWRVCENNLGFPTALGEDAIVRCPSPTLQVVLLGQWNSIGFSHFFHICATYW